MRAFLFALCLFPLAAQAQVTTNDQALDSLNAAKTKPASHATSRTRGTHHERSARHSTEPRRETPAPKPLTMPAAPPPNPVIAPPPLVMPSHPPPPPPPVPLRADAKGEASPIDGGTRITFGAGSPALNPGTFRALQAIAATAKANPALIVTITAWAPGTADDPSTPRRLSLDRALAARAVLINAGIASARIHALAKGMDAIGDAPPDRADITAASPTQHATESAH